MFLKFVWNVFAITLVLVAVADIGRSQDGTDGHRLTTGSSDRAIRLWEAHTGALLAWPAAEKVLIGNRAAVFNHAAVANQMKCSACHSPMTAEVAWTNLDGFTVSPNPLGIQVVAVGPEFAGYLGLNVPAVIASDVPETTPAYQGGLRSYDVVLKANDVTLESPQQFNQVVTTFAGKSLLLTVLRKGAEKQLTVTIPGIVATAASQPGGDAQAAQPSAYKLGVVLAPVDESLSSHLNLPKGEGLLLTEVTADGPAAQAGCATNDILIAIDGHPITDQPQLKTLVQEIGNREVGLKLVRRGQELEVKIKPILMKEPTEQANANGYFYYPAESGSIYRRYWLELASPQSIVLGDHIFKPAQDAKPSENRTEIQKVKSTVAELQTKMAELVNALEALEKETPPK